MQSQCSGGLTHHDDNADCDGSGCLLACLTACPSARCLCAYLGKPHLPAPPPPPSIHPFRPSVPLLFIYSSLPPLILPPPSLPSLAPMCDKAISSLLLSSPLLLLPSRRKQERALLRGQTILGQRHHRLIGSPRKSDCNRITPLQLLSLLFSFFSPSPCSSPSHT